MIHLMKGFKHADGASIVNTCSHLLQCDQASCAVTRMPIAVFIEILRLDTAILLLGVCTMLAS